MQYMGLEGSSNDAAHDLALGQLEGNGQESKRAYLSSLKRTRRPWAVEDSLAFEDEERVGGTASRSRRARSRFRPPGSGVRRFWQSQSQSPRPPATHTLGYS